MEKLEIGSTIFKTSYWSGSFETIARETKTLWITQDDRTKIYKKDNSVVGGTYSVVLATQEHYEKQEKSCLISVFREFDTC